MSSWIFGCIMTQTRQRSFHSVAAQRLTTLILRLYLPKTPNDILKPTTSAAQFGWQYPVTPTGEPFTYSFLFPVIFVFYFYHNN